jgi:hypothetical protein
MPLPRPRQKNPDAARTYGVQLRRRTATAIEALGQHVPGMIRPTMTMLVRACVHAGLARLRADPSLISQYLVMVPDERATNGQPATPSDDEGGR